MPRRLAALAAGVLPAALLGGVSTAAGEPSRPGRRRPRPAPAPDVVTRRPTDPTPAGAGRRTVSVAPLVGRPRPAERAGDHDRRHAQRRPALHAARAAPDRRPGRQLHQHVLAAAAVLPGARVVPDRPVLPQPPRLVARAALRLPGASTTARRCRPALNQAGYDTAFLGKYLNGYGAQPLPVTGGRRSATSRRAGPTGTAPVDAASPASGRSTAAPTTTCTRSLNDERPHRRHPPGQLPDRRCWAGSPATGAQYHRSPRPFFLYVSAVAPHFGGPREADDPAPRAPRTTARPQAVQTPARPPRVRGSFDRQITRASGLPRASGDVRDKPFFIRQAAADGQPRARARRAVARTDLTRQRAEALSCSTSRSAGSCATLQADRRVRQHRTCMFTSDNGYFLGEHRMRQGKILPHEPSLRVPLMIRGPGIPHGRGALRPVHDDRLRADDPRRGRRAGPADRRRREPARASPSTATAAGTAASSPRPARGGVSQDAEESDNFLVGESGPSPLRFSQGVRTGDYLYVEHASRERELYDLRSDPREVDQPGGPAGDAAGRPRCWRTSSTCCATAWARTADARCPRCCGPRAPAAPLPPSGRPD